jgi:predicted MFS family arabinose efflux permease
MTSEAGPVELPNALLPTRYAVNRRLVLLATGMFAIGTDSFVIAGLLSTIANDLNVSIAVAGQLITTYALCYAIFTPITAVITANWRRQSVLLTGLLLFILGNIISAFGTTFFLVLVGRGVSGLGAATFAPMASATATAIVSEKKRASALAVIMVALSTATAFGAPIGTVIGTVLSWRYTFLIVAAVAVVAAIGVAISLNHAPAGNALSLKTRLRPLKDRRVLLILFTTFLVLSGLYITYSYIGVVFDRATQGSGVTLALLIFVWGIAGTAGSLVSGHLTDRIGSRIVINTSLILLALNFAILPWASGTLGYSIIALLVWGFFGWGFVIPQQHHLIESAPENAAILLSLYAMAVYGGTSVSGAVGAGAATVFGYHQLPLIGAAFILCGLVVSEYARSKIAQDT